MALLRGTLDPIVLKTVSWSPMHAFEITAWIEQRSDGRVEVEDAALLQALHRLEDRRLIAAEWGVTKNGRRARYYRITPAGREHLKAESSRLVDHLDAVVAILSAKTAK
ncbi:MAG TPA: helix-turn-helix transcriptional regulator [Gemmatimonadaceae bacterium]|jgi:transcriptional regulator|nr:helix-turn-helix transcriptional regulator [Gemmatimonadaceae bacterium]